MEYGTEAGGMALRDAAMNEKIEAMGAGSELQKEMRRMLFKTRARTFSLVKSEACCRRVISSRRGWRHVPGVPVPLAAKDVVGVAGVDDIVSDILPKWWMKSRCWCLAFRC